MNRAHRSIIVLGTALLVGNCVPVAAYADTSAELQAQLNQAQSDLSGLYADAEDASNELNKTMDDLMFTQKSIDETSVQIQDRQSELNAAQETLKQTVSTQYKDGTISLLSILLSSADLEDFIGRLYYANKVSASYSEQINTVKDLQNDLTMKQASLEEQKLSLEQLRDEQEKRKDELNASTAEVQAYVNGLSTELQEALAAEEAARVEAERAAAEAALEAARAEEAAKAAEAEEAAQREQPAAQQEVHDNSAQQSEDEPQAQAAHTNEQQSSTAEPASSGLSNMEARTAVVNYVLAQMDKPYVWATHGPDSFDCSGLTGAAYEQIGYFIGYSDSYQEQYCNKPASAAVYGDIVWRPGHVGICIGNGVTVEAHSPSMGIGYGSVSNFQRSGSPLG